MQFIFFEQHQDKIYWCCLSRNPNALHILKQNIHEIKWPYFYTNPSIFTLTPKVQIMNFILNL